MKAPDSTLYSQQNALQGIEITSVWRSSHAFPKHRHEDKYTLILVEEGSSYCVGPEQGETVITPEKVALINPGQVHSGVPTPSSCLSYWTISISLEAMEMALCESIHTPGELPEFQKILVVDPVLKHHLGKLATAMVTPAGRMEQDAALCELMEHLVSHHSSRRCDFQECYDSHLVCLAKEFLSEDLSRKMTLEEVADAVGLSRYHFLRVFKREAGVPPHVFRTQRRLDIAQTLLRRGMPLSQVALETGFTDQSHFTKRFKQFTGTTPKQYLCRQARLPMAS